MTDRENLQRIKERIAKLLAMAKDASSPNEAAIAAQRARALMDKHQIDEYDVSEAAPQVFAYEAVTRAFAAVPHHISILSVAVAQYNDCQSIMHQAKMDYKMESKANQNAKVGNGATKAYGVKIFFRGYEADVALAKEMFERLLDNIDALCKKYMQANHPGRYNVRIGGEYKHGAAKAIMAKFDEMKIEREKLTYSNGTALVVSKQKAVEEQYGEVEYVSAKKKSSVKDYEAELDNIRAKSAGWVDGQKIEIIKRLDD